MQEFKSRHAIVLSLRAKWCPEIFSGRKRIEYRKFFPEWFSGKIYVYECGPGSRHKIIGVFRTDRVARWNPQSGETDKVADAFAYAHAPLPELEDLIANEDNPLTCIPVMAPRLLTRPLTLKEFSERYKASPIIDFPPMSWQKTRIDYSVIDEIVEPCDMQEGVDIHSRSEYTTKSNGGKK